MYITGTILFSSVEFNLKEVLMGYNHSDTGAGFLLHVLQFPLANHIFNNVPALSTIGPLEMSVVRVSASEPSFYTLPLVFSWAAQIKYTLPYLLLGIRVLWET